MSRREKKSISPLGGLETDVMVIIWRLEKATVKEVWEIIYKDRRLAYTTIMTVMNRLAQKGVLRQNRDQITYVYTSLKSRDELVKTILDNIIERVLEGSPQVIIDYLKAELNKKPLT